MIVATNRVGRRIAAYREASRRATGDVTGFLGEVLGAAQAVQIAGAEEPVARHFERLGERRRATALRDRLFNELMNSVFRNTVSLGTGLILILAGHALRSGSFTVGDLALFIYYLGFITEFTGKTGAFMAHYKQMGVSFSRMVELMQGARALRAREARSEPPARRAGRGARAAQERRGSARSPGGARSHLPLPGYRTRRERGGPVAATRLIHGHRRTHRRGKDGAPAGAARAGARRVAARSAGTGRWFQTRPASWCRRAAPTRPRCPGSSARACGTTF